MRTTGIFDERALSQQLSDVYRFSKNDTANAVTTRGQKHTCFNYVMKISTHETMCNNCNNKAVSALSLNNIPYYSYHFIFLLSKTQVLNNINIKSNW